MLPQRRLQAGSRQDLSAVMRRPRQRWSSTVAVIAVLAVCLTALAGLRHQLLLSCDAVASTRAAMEAMEAASDRRLSTDLGEPHQLRWLLGIALPCHGTGRERQFAESDVPRPGGAASNPRRAAGAFAAQMLCAS
jgi:hypothetical protein